MIEMKEQRQDFELLQRFARYGEQPAFADLVRRHLDLVFATALRSTGDAGGAQEISQNVFSALARKAWQFAPDDSLPAWLHKAALLESKSWLRGELRRRRREETAAELGTTMKPPDDQPAFNALVPLLDDALLSLREKDRAALLLRFYESQSLRDVGAALGVSEDTAHKRVQSALERLAGFFQHQGFRTATAAAAAVVLRSTSTSASAKVLTSVLGSALKVGPPALLGLGWLLSRLAGLSRAQTAAVCLALAAVPVAWQFNERHAASEEGRQMLVQLLAAQNETVAVQSEVERMRAAFGKLEQSVAQANEAAARAAESAQAYEAWKQKTRGQLMAANYHWSDDSAFVRIPKAVLPELNELAKSSPFSPPGIITPYARELFCLTPSERQTLEETLQRVAELQRGEKAEVYTLDNAPSGRVVASRDFKDQPPGIAGAEAEQRFAQMLTDIRSVLGEERWLDMPDRCKNVNCKVLNRALIPEPKAQLSVTVETDGKAAPKARWMFVGDFTGFGSGGEKAAKPAKAPAAAPSTSVSGGGAQSGNVYSVNVVGYTKGTAALSGFLPDGNPDQTKDAASFFGGFPASDALRQSVSAWLQEEAAARLGGKEKR